MSTPYALRLKLAKTFDFEIDRIREWAKNIDGGSCYNNNENSNVKLLGDLVPNDEIRKLLINDTLAVLAYRRRSGGSITIETVRKWFPKFDTATTTTTKTTTRKRVRSQEEEDDDDMEKNTNNVYDDDDGRSPTIESLFAMIDQNRDFIYTAAGVKLLENRYMFIDEPIQLCMIRLALILTEHCPTLLKSAYDMISCGMIQVSSAVAATEHFLKENNNNSATSAVYPGEACRLMVAKDGYSYELVRQIEKVCTLISMGVGVGYGVSNLPLYGKKDRGFVRSGFNSLIKRLNACNFVTLHERKPKVALYLHVHNDTLFEALNVKVPSKIPVDNVFIGLMIPDYFMECVKKDEAWYLFSGDIEVDGARLSDYYGNEYRVEYEKWVRKKLYTQRYNAREIMDRILESLIQSGSPYIIWLDALNEYNNQKAFGTLKTLNLCAEITNYTDSELDSSCTLLSCNMAMYKDFPRVLHDLYFTLCRDMGVDYRCEDFGEYADVARYAYMLGYLGTRFLNSLLGKERKRREIGLNPLGVYDMALMTMNDDHLSPQKICAIVCESLYKGAIQSSCDLYQKIGIKCVMYDMSKFASGVPQWMLRGVQPVSDWSSLLPRMTQGMSNSMLTAQAPTATTSMLVGVTESVSLPISAFVAKESDNGRDKFITYGLMYRCAYKKTLLPVKNDIDSQLAMYKDSLPYVDHSQSAMFTISLDEQQIFDLIVKTYKARMKTGIYYLLFKQEHPTLDGIKEDDRTTAPPTIKDANNNTYNNRNSCDSCSL